jgi:Glycosidases
MRHRREPAERETSWWRDAVFYQIYLRSFADSDGDGVGDLGGVRSRLGYLELLGVDGLWLTPFFPSPMVDNGYDVADPRDVDPLFGNLDAFHALIDDTHTQGMKVTIDLVPNHTSDAHEWFTAALEAGPGSPERDRYIFREGKGATGELPPNNWISAFGGPAWSRVDGECGGQWYLHLFAPEPTLTGTTPMFARISIAPSGSGWTAALTGSGSMSRTAWPSRPGCPTWMCAQRRQ